jgi:hypothetical protein
MPLDACQTLGVRCICDNDCPAERSRCDPIDAAFGGFFGGIRYCH